VAAPKIYVIDIETAPKIAYVWRFFKEHVGAKQVLDHGHIMSFAAKRLGDDQIIYKENRKDDDKAITQALIDVLDDADIVIAQNGDRFDLPSINGRALVHGLKPPSPYKTVDTLKVARNEFKFERNSLEYLAIILGCAPKDQHKDFPGFELWLECLRGNDAAWNEMRLYNIQDILTLEEVYIKMRPWIRNHANLGIYIEHDGPVCPKCGSVHVTRRGYTTTNTGKYQRFRCNDCGGWARSRITELPKELRKVLLVNAV
jgi:predicted RNA-binding Zn-ribbon protein involved in translation (DUF1610 family)